MSIAELYEKQHSEITKNYAITSRDVDALRHVLLCLFVYLNFNISFVVFSVTRRSRSDKSIDFTDVTLASEDTYRRLHWCDPDDSDGHDDPDDR